MNQRLLILAHALTLAACTNQMPNTESASSGAANTPLMVINKTMSRNATSFALPRDGGLVGSLFVQPRDLMSAPDTQTVGCGQAGAGALGLDAYLGQPAWITQNVLLDGLFVPTRNFSLGFPTADAGGSVLPVRSYFVIQGRGFFKLADGDPEGDYQFSVIADDAARLKIGNGDDYPTFVDGQKPAGPNAGCLEQTQAAHMSCTTDWADQSAAKVKTVHLSPGQLVPIDFQYWQGPGLGISMMAFYRRVDAARPPIDPACGRELSFGAGQAGLNGVLASWTPIGAGNLTNTYR
jgi:hypothetical protein